jgi:7-cyano-7-deazaguanine synthase in queuosine biosynthesis
MGQIVDTNSNSNVPMRNTICMATLTVAMAMFSSNIGASNDIYTFFDTDASQAIYPDTRSDNIRGIENQNIVDVISIPEKKNYRERYKRISQSATFKRVYHNKSIGDVISVEN